MKKFLFLMVCLFTANLSFAGDYLLFYKWSMRGADLYSTTDENTNVMTRKINQRGFVYGYFDDENITWSELKLLKFWKDKTDKQFYYTIEPFMYGGPDIAKKPLAKGDVWEMACIGESIKSESMKKGFKISDTLELRIPKKFTGSSAWNVEFADGAISVGTGKIKMTLDSKKTKDYYDLKKFTNAELVNLLGLGKYVFKKSNPAESKYGATYVYLADAIFARLGVGTQDNYYLFPATAGSPGEVLVFNDTGELEFRPISSRDSYLLKRANHYGQQPASTISDFDAAASACTQVKSNKATLEGLNIPAGFDATDINTRLGVTEGIATGAKTQSGTNKTTLDNLKIPAGVDLTDINTRLSATESTATTANTLSGVNKGTLDNLKIPAGVDLTDINTRLGTTEGVATGANTQAGSNKATLDNLKIPAGVDLTDINTRLGTTEGVATGAATAAATADGKAVAAQTTANTANTQAGTNKTTLDNLKIPAGVDLTDINNRLGVTEGVATGAATAAAAAQGTANTANAQAGTNKTTLDNLNIPAGFDATSINTRLGVTEGVATGAAAAAATADGKAVTADGKTVTNATEIATVKGSLAEVATSGSYLNLSDTPNTPNPWTSKYTLIADMNTAENAGAPRFFHIPKQYAAEGSFIFGIPPAAGGDDIHIILPSAADCDVNDSLRFYCSTLLSRLVYIQVKDANKNPTEHFFNAQKGKVVYQLRTASSSYGEFSYVTFNVIPNPSNPTEKIWFFHDCSDTEWSTDLVNPVPGFAAGIAEGTLTILDNTIAHPKGINPPN